MKKIKLLATLFAFSLFTCLNTNKSYAKNKKRSLPKTSCQQKKKKLIVAVGTLLPGAALIAWWSMQDTKTNHVSFTSDSQTLSIEAYRNSAKQDTQFINYSIFDHAVINGKKFQVKNPGTYIKENAVKNKQMDRSIGAMYGMAIGDATGAPLEFCSIEKLKDHKPSRFNLKERKYHNPNNKFELKPGQWTDDASMGLCIADSLLKKEKYDGRDIRIRFTCWWRGGYNNTFKHDKDESRRLGRTSVGLGGNISKSIIDVIKTKKVSPTYLTPGANDDSGNGSLMRLASIPVFYSSDDIGTCMHYAEQSSFTTHPGYIASECCKLLSYIIHKNINRNKEIGIKAWLDQILQTYKEVHLAKQKVNESANSTKHKEALKLIEKIIDAKEDAKGKEANWNWRTDPANYIQLTLDTYKVRGGKKGKYNNYPVSPTYWGSYCMDGLAIALHAAYHSQSFADGILIAINLLGDADTTGSIAGQIVGSFYGFNNLYDNPDHKPLFENVYQWDKGEIGLRAILLHSKNKLVNTELK